MRTLILASLFSLTFMSTGFAQEEMMMEPTEHHKLLAKAVGTWDADMTMWMAGPDGEATKTKGTETVEMFGEFWSVGQLKYDFMGMPVTGRSTIGYDPAKNKFVGTWIDTTSAFAAQMSGDYDKETKTFTYMGEMPGPDGNTSPFKIIERHTDDDNKTFEMHMQSPGSDELVKFMEIKYSRKK